MVAGSPLLKTADSKPKGELSTIFLQMGNFSAIPNIKEV
jgi:hypothetical protein